MLVRGFKRFTFSWRFLFNLPLQHLIKLVTRFGEFWNGGRVLGRNWMRSKLPSRSR